MAEVGKHIRKIRKEKNLTQDELAERLYCTRQTISNYENGKSQPSIELLIEIAGVLEVDINDLIYGPKKKENREKRKITSVIILIAAVILQAAIAILTPRAREYAWKRFVTYPMYFLHYVLRPFAGVLLGWGIVEVVRELSGFRIWSGKPRRIIRFAQIMFYMVAAFLAAAAVVTLLVGLGVVPEPFQKVFIYFFFNVNEFAGGYLFLVLGVALAFFRTKKEEPSKEAEN